MVVCGVITAWYELGSLFLQGVGGVSCEQEDKADACDTSMHDCLVSDWYFLDGESSER